MTEEEEEIFTQKILKKIMKIVNKHHDPLLIRIAQYRKELSDFKLEQRTFINKIYNSLGEFNKEKDNLPKKLHSIEKLIQEHMIGVQRVYDEMQEIKKLLTQRENEE